MNGVQLTIENIEEKSVAIDFFKETETHYEFLSNNEAVALTDRVIKRYRPALEELAK
jgi:riboflavin synthase alpha subunit